MARFLKSRKKAKGAAPGSLIFLGNQKMDSPRIRLFSYNQKNTSENEYTDIEKALLDIKPGYVSWLNIDGIHDTSIIQKIGGHFNVSSIALENILNTDQRPKLFMDNDSLTLLSKAVEFDSNINRISVEQISFILLKGVLISFQEKPGDHFEPVRERIRKSIGRIRGASSDYLLYALLDSLVDNYLINIEVIGDKIEQLEEKLSIPAKETSAAIFHYKTEISYFRKAIRPLKEAILLLLKSNLELIDKDTVTFFQELFDLIDHSIEATDTYHVMISDHINVYNTNLSNRVNDVMKVLTIFASIFIPLTFIAGIYGTNFDYLPELHFKYSYFIMWGLMILVAVIMLFYFRRNKWF